MSSGAPGIIWLILLLFSAVGLGLTYWSLGRVINRTEIRVLGGRLIVRQKPLPWRYNADLPASDIQNISQETYYNRSRSSSFGRGYSVETSVRNERLAAFTQDGKKHILIPKMELAAAQFLAGETEQLLGLRQAQTETERSAGLQASKQEQKRVEISQAMSLMPILFLMTPVLLILGIWLLISTINGQREGRASLTWPSIEAHVAKHRIDRTYEKHENRPDTTYFTPVVIYEYVVAGDTYQTEKYLSGRSESELVAAEKFDNYPIGSALTIFYNPEKPARSRYVRGPTNPTVPFIMAGVCLALIPLVIVLMLFMARENCRVNGCPDDWKHMPFWLRQVPFLGRA